MKPLSQTRGSRRHPIHVHLWSDGSVKKTTVENNIDASVQNLFDKSWEKSSSVNSNSDGQEIKDFRKSLSTEHKKFFSEYQGERFGQRYVTEILGYQEKFHGDDKTDSMSQGLDGVYYDSKTQQLVVVEFKGQDSRLTDDQKDPNWTIDRCQKIQNGEDNYIQATDAERKIANEILDAYNRGGRIRYEVVRTEVSERTGKFKSQLEKRTIIEKPTTEKTESKAVVDKLYSESKDSSKDSSQDSKQESKSESKSESKKG